MELVARLAAAALLSRAGLPAADNPAAASKLERADRRPRVEFKVPEARRGLAALALEAPALVAPALVAPSPVPPQQRRAGIREQAAER